MSKFLLSQETSSLLWGVIETDWFIGVMGHQVLYIFMCLLLRLVLVFFVFIDIDVHNIGYTITELKL